jgi:FG-GAP repeat
LSRNSRRRRSYQLDMIGFRRAALTTAVAFAAVAGLAPPAGAVDVPPSGTLDLSEGADVVLQGERGTAAGATVAPAGDFDGDGSLDLLVGDPGANPAGRDGAGSAYVVFGPLAGMPTDLARLGDRGVRIDGAAAGDRLGTAVSAAGDVDGDGLGDVIVGAPRNDDEPGAAYLVLGRRGGRHIDLAGRGSNAIRLRLGEARDHVGVTVGSAPDMDGDGRAELLVGADRVGYVDDPAAPLPSGAAFVVFAKAATGDVDLSDLGDRGIRLDGPVGSGAGLGLVGIPDLNGDGRGEVVVGAPTFGARSPAGSTARPHPHSGPGRAYVVFGTAAPGRVDLASLGDGGITVLAGPGDGFLGVSPFPLGDVTGDGVADLAFGAPYSDRNERGDSGSVHVVAGQRGPGTIDLGTAGRPGFRVDGGVAGDRLGSWVDAVPDVNGDTHPELLLAAAGADAVSRTDAGAAYVVFGAAGDQDDLDVSGLRDRGYRIAGPAASSALGAVAGLGDYNGDGRGDLIAGTAGASAAYLVLGPTPPPPTTPDPGEVEEVAAGCRAAENVEVVIDDSGSMAETDPLQLSRQATELLISKPRSEGKVIGVFEFGTEGAQIFPPTLIVPRGQPGSNKPELLRALRAAIGADNGSTDYNLGLKGAADDNPAAQARLFITDGAHNAGDYTEQHRGGPPTYVIGLGEESDTGEFRRRLRRIARETNGRAFTGVTVENIVAVVNRIDSRLNCDVDIDTDVDRLTEDDPVEEQVVELDPDAHTLDVEVSWGDENEDVEPEAIEFLDEEDDVVARVSGRRLRRIIERPGRTFTVAGIQLKGTEQRGRFGLRLTTPDAERVRIRYRATRVRGRRARVTSQVSQSRRRNVEQAGR